MHCGRCGHLGLKAKELQLLFTGQHEYVFSYGPSLSYLKVVLSTVALNLFRVQGTDTGPTGNLCRRVGAADGTGMWHCAALRGPGPFKLL